VLVTYKITVAADVTLPVELKLHIPAEAGRPNNLVRRDMDGLYYPLSYTVKPDGQWLEVSFTTSSSQVEMEYYDPNLIRNGKQHRFDYIWPGDYFVHQMTLRVQQPANATNMDLSPSTGTAPVVKPGATQPPPDTASQVGTARSEEDGFYYYSILFNNIYGSPLHLGITYDKPDSALSSDLQPVKLLEPVQAESGFMLALKTIPWLPLIGGLVLALAAIIILLEGGRHLPLVTAHYDDDDKGDKKVVYCQNCGKRSDPGKETICSSCGEKLPPA
jgi:hypothetical protein